MNSQGQRLKAARKAAGYKTALMATEANGWNASTYRGHESGVREISKNMAYSYSRAFKVSASWLLYGVEDVQLVGRRHHGQTNSEAIHDDAIGTRRVPIVPIGAVDQMERNDPKELRELLGKWVSVANLNLGPSPIATQVTDLSMSDVLKPGDLVISDDTAPLVPGCVVVVAAEGDAEASIRHYAHGKTDESIVLYPANPDWGSRKEFEKKKLRVLRRGVWQMRAL